MKHGLLVYLIACWSLAVAQVRLEFPPVVYSATNLNYSHVLPVPGGGRLLVGSQQVVTLSPIGGYSAHTQIALTVLGPTGLAQFQPRAIRGSGNDIPQAAVFDSRGNLWVVGNTDSDDFPLVNPIVAQKIAYHTAGFVVELDPTGNKILFSTYLAGYTPSSSASFTPFSTSATAIALDSAGNAYVGGSTNDPGFPTTPGAYLSAPAAPGYERISFSYLAKISPAGKLVYATELRTGSAHCQFANTCLLSVSVYASVTAVFADSAGAATVAGRFGGSGFPDTAYVWRVAADGSRLLWRNDTIIQSAIGQSATGYDTISLFAAPDSTASQGASTDTGNVNLFGAYAAVKGGCLANESGVLPCELGPPMLFAAQLNADGSGYNYWMDLGQSAGAIALGVAVDPSGNVYLAGSSSSPQLAPPVDLPNLGPDFVLELDATGLRIRPPLHFPSGVLTNPPALDFSSIPNLMLIGAQNSVLTVPANYGFDSPAIVSFANSATLVLTPNTGLYPGALVTIFGFDLFSPEGIQVLVNGTPAPILFAGPTQINLQVPFTTYGPAQVQVVSRLGTVTAALPVVRSIGIFTIDGVHAAALNQDGTVNSVANPATLGSIVSLFGTGAIWPSGMRDGATSVSELPLYLNAFEADGWDGTPLYVPYAGAAPGLIDGVFQIDAQLPQTLPQFGRQPTLGLRSGSLASNTVQVYLK